MKYKKQEALPAVTDLFYRDGGNKKVIRLCYRERCINYEPDGDPECVHNCRLGLAFGSYTLEPCRSFMPVLKPQLPKVTRDACEKAIKKLYDSGISDWRLTLAGVDWSIGKWEQGDFETYQINAPCGLCFAARFPCKNNRTLRCERADNIIKLCTYYKWYTDNGFDGCCYGDEPQRTLNQLYRFKAWLLKENGYEPDMRVVSDTLNIKQQNIYNPMCYNKCKIFKDGACAKPDDEIQQIIPIVNTGIPCPAAEFDIYQVEKSDAETIINNQAKMIKELDLLLREKNNTIRKREEFIYNQENSIDKKNKEIERLQKLNRARCDEVENKDKEILELRKHVGKLMSNSSRNGKKIERIKEAIKESKRYALSKCRELFGISVPECNNMDDCYSCALKYISKIIEE